MLIALLLPAIQSAREASRRSSCQVKLKQLALAAHNHQDVHDYLPPGANKYNRTNNTYLYRYSAFVPMLPFLERGTLFDTFMNSFSSIDPWLNNAFTQADMGGILFCPSDGNITARVHPLTMTSYRVCNGDWPDRGDIAQSDYENKRGVFSGFRDAKLSLVSISDGTSNTILFSEGGLAMEAALTKMPIIGAMARITKNLPQANQSPKDEFSADECLGTKGTSGAYYAPSSTVNVNVGVRAFDSLIMYTGFATILPPNSPSCYRNTADDESNSGNTRFASLISATSYHANGVNIALGDGSVRFVNESINWGGATALTAKCVDGGASPFGIWGAMGSVNGGEAVSLP
jgi:prepilin-type processing-associated H-X9-DG protein